MITILYITLILLGIIFEWPKNSAIYDLIVISACTFMVAICTTHADYIAYYAQYMAVIPSFAVMSEPIWAMLNYLFRALGFSYSIFIGVQTAVTLFFVAIAARRLSISTPFMWSLFLIYPGLIGFVQIRQSLAMSVVFLAFSYLINDRKSSGIAFYILVFIAGLIHKTAFFVMILPLAKRFFSHKVFLVLFILSSLLSALQTGWMVNLARSLFTDEKSLAYLAGYGGVASNLSRIFTVCESIGAVGLIIICAHLKSFQTNDTASIAYTYLLPFNLLFVVLIPVLIVNTDFLRFMRYPLLLNITILGILSPLSSNQSQRLPYYERYPLRLIVTGFYVTLFYGLVWMQAQDSVVAALLQWN